MSRKRFSGGPVELEMRRKLIDKLCPVHLAVINESYKHNTQPQAESHFKLLVVSNYFKDMSLVNRHRAVNSCLTDELATTVHAISIDAKTPAQWREDPDVSQTPNCLGGLAA